MRQAKAKSPTTPTPTPTSRVDTRQTILEPAPTPIVIQSKDAYVVRTNDAEGTHWKVHTGFNFVIPDSDTGKAPAAAMVPSGQEYHVTINLRRFGDSKMGYASIDLSDEGPHEATRDLYRYARVAYYPPGLKLDFITPAQCYNLPPPLYSPRIYLDIDPHIDVFNNEKSLRMARLSQGQVLFVVGKPVGVVIYAVPRNYYPGQGASKGEDSVYISIDLP
jgi:hypothetical protein